MPGPRLAYVALVTTVFGPFRPSLPLPLALALSLSLPYPVIFGRSAWSDAISVAKTAPLHGRTPGAC